MVGIISDRRGEAVPRSNVDQLASAYESLRGIGSRESAAAGHFARLTRITEPTRGPGECVQLGPDSSWRPCSGTPHDWGSDGRTRLENLDGQFAWAAYDVDNDELSVATDPFGMQAVFIARRNGTTYVSTSALALAKHLRARPSRLGVATFLRAGY